MLSSGKPKYLAVGYMALNKWRFFILWKVDTAVEQGPGTLFLQVGQRSRGFLNRVVFLGAAMSSVFSSGY